MLDFLHRNINNAYNITPSIWFMRKYNFYPGPSTLPLKVLKAYRDEMLEFQDTGASFIELSHRSEEVVACHNHIVQMLRAMLKIGDDYHVLLLPGGAIGQYAAIPMNLGGPMEVAITGHWSKIASAELAKYASVNICTDSFPECASIADPASWDIRSDSKYVVYVDNETVHGVEFPEPPAVGELPLVIDQSSNILSRPIDMSNVGVLFACLQKNLGPSGLAVVIVRADLCAAPSPQVPRIWDYALQAKSDSMANTAATFQFRMLEMMLEWIEDRGGVERLSRLNREKAQKLYDYIDSDDFYRNPVEERYRSRMNVPFTLANDSLDDLFVKESAAAGLIGLKGHRAVGGMRASIYNAMPQEGITALISFMDDFKRRKA